MGNTIERCEVVNDLNGGGVKAVRLTDGRYVTEKLARELEEEIQGERKKLIEAFGPMNGEQVIAIKDFARHFYELGKQSGGGFEIPADLEKAADEMALRAFPEKKSYSTVIDRVVDYNARDRENYRDGIIAGAKWQKEQMLKEAVEAKIYGYDDGSFELIASWLDMPNNSIYKDGDKVRIIICKKED